MASDPELAIQHGREGADRGAVLSLPDGLAETFVNNARYYGDTILRADDESVSCDDGLHDECSGLVYGRDWDARQPTAGYCTCRCHEGWTP
jgi:hypothetical protein